MSYFSLLHHQFPKVSDVKEEIIHLSVNSPSHHSLFMVSNS